MTVLSPATPVLPHLEKVGEYLMRADLGLDASPQVVTTASERRERIAHLRLDAQLRASVDLDGAYSVSLGMVYLLRALEALCEMETSPGTRQGSDLLVARGYLERAGKSVLAAVRQRMIQAHGHAA